MPWSSIKYSEYLRSGWWQKRRCQALDESGWACSVCFSEVDLQVHHRNYENLGCEKKEDLVVACEVCHNIWHFKESQKSERFIEAFAL